MDALLPSRYGLNSHDSFTSVKSLISGIESMQSLSEIQSHLESIYCGSAAVDFSAIEVNDSF